VIRVDFTQFSCVAWCDECGWRAQTGDRGTAWRRARTHEQSRHAGTRQATKAAGHAAMRDLP
jgi:hypothetical protein